MLRGRLFRARLGVSCIDLPTTSNHLPFEYSYLPNKPRVANNRGVWKKYLNLINKGFETNE